MGTARSQAIQGLRTQEHNEDNFHNRVPQYFSFSPTANGGGGDAKIRYFTHQVCAVGSASVVGAEEICIGGESSANPPGGS